MDLSLCASCSLPTMAEVFSQMEGCSVVFHTPQGCATSRFSLGKRGGPSTVMGSNLGEADMILGTDQRLGEILKQTVDRHHPRVIFVAAGCSSTITGDELQWACHSWAGKFKIPLVPLVCEVAGLKVWKTGYEPQKTDLMAMTVAQAEVKKDFFNVIDFSGDSQVCDLLGAQNPGTWNFVTRHSPFENWQRMGAARGTFCLSLDKISTLVASRLEADYGVPRHDVSLPYGFCGSERFFTQVGKTLGNPQLFQAALRSEKEKYMAPLLEAKNLLRGKRCLFLTSAAFGAETMAFLSMVQETGMEVLGAKDYLRKALAEGSPLDPWLETGSSVEELFLQRALAEMPPHIMVVKDEKLLARWSTPRDYPALVVGETGWQGFAGFARLATQLARQFKRRALRPTTAGSGVLS